MIGDVIDTVLRRRPPLTPPRRLRWFIGGGDFERIGERFARFMVDTANLRPTDAVLDVGCGIGRVAVPLTGYLGKGGRYEGFDVVQPAIAWCDRAISTRYANFRFQHADIHNTRYNPEGKHRADTFRYPYPPGSFDVVFAQSVFTHMLPKGVENYLFETSRVLKPGGHSIATFFLLDEEAIRAIEAGRAVPRFKMVGEHHRSLDERVPERAVALDVDWIERLHERAGLELVHRRLGRWRSNEPDWIRQDIVVARKRIP